MRRKRPDTALSRIENHAENIGLSTLEKFAEALGKPLRLQLAACGSWERETIAGGHFANDESVLQRFWRR